MKPRHIFLMCTLFVSANISNAAEMKPQDIYLKTVGSIATIRTEDNFGRKYIGTAFAAMQDGVLVTAWHLMKNAKVATVHFKSGEDFKVEGIIDFDEKRDIAFVRIKASGIPILNVSPNIMEVGIPVYIIGAPKGLEFSITNGLLSQVQRIDGYNIYQFSSPASPGNSGGPLLNDFGHVIGIVTSQHMEGQNLNFATPSTYILELARPRSKNLKKEIIIGNKNDNSSTKTSPEIYDKVFISRDYWKGINWKDFYKDKIISWLENTSESFSGPKGQIDQLRKSKSTFFGIPVEVRLNKESWGGDFPYKLHIMLDYDSDSDVNLEMLRTALTRIENGLGPSSIKNDFSFQNDQNQSDLNILNVRSQWDIDESRIYIEMNTIEFKNDNMRENKVKPFPVFFITATHKELTESDIEAFSLRCSKKMSIEINGKITKTENRKDVILIIDERNKTVYNIHMIKLAKLTISKKEISYETTGNKGSSTNMINRITGEYNEIFIPIDQNERFKTKILVSGQCEKIDPKKTKF